MLSFLITTFALGGAATGAPAGSITQVDLPAFTVGADATVVVVVKNQGDGSDLLVEPGAVPDGWSVSPSYVEVVIAPGSTGSAAFVVTPGSAGGTLGFTLSYDDIGPWNTSLDTWESAVTAVSGPPNLVVQSILLDPAPPAVGHEVTVTATLRNEGPGSVDSFFCIGGDIRVAFELDGTRIGLETLACGLDPDESDPESITMVVASPGTHTLRVIIDPDNVLEEADEDDNALSIPVTVALPDLTISANVPAVGAPGEHAIPVSVTVQNDTETDLDDLWVSLQFDDQAPIDLGWAQDSDVSAAGSITFSGLASLGSTSNDVAFAPGKHAWRVQVWNGALGASNGGFAVSDERTFPIEVVDTVLVTPANIVVPIVPPAQAPYGLTSEVTATRLSILGGEFDAVLGFNSEIDPTADGTAVVLSALARADVFDEAGDPVCDPVLRRDILRGFLIWRDLIAEHGWYQSTFVAVQEGFEWYASEGHLKLAYYITQPFVILSELMDDLFKAGKHLAGWLGEKVGFGDENEAAVGTETLAAVIRITKGYEAVDEGIRAIMKLSPLLQGQPYLSDHVVTERLIQAIEGEGVDLDDASQMVHDIIAASAPEAYAGFSAVLTKELILKAIKKTLVKGAKEVLWTAVKHGFTAYFVAQLTAKTAIQVAIGEGSAALLAGLTTAGIAKGIASLGITLLIDAAIAYLSYTGTFINNVRGKGGLCESGRVIAQSVPWTHVKYHLDGSTGALDVDNAERTFLAHSALFELYGFVNADLATLKKLAFAFAQSDEFKAESESMFDIARTQRDLAVSLEAVLAAVPSPACDTAPLPAPEAEYRGPPKPPEDQPAEPAPARTRWSKRPEASPVPPDDAPRGPPVRDRPSTPDATVEGAETGGPTDADTGVAGGAPSATASSCATSRSSGDWGPVVLLLLTVIALIPTVRRRVW